MAIRSFGACLAAVSLVVLLMYGLDAQEPTDPPLSPSPHSSSEQDTALPVFEYSDRTKSQMQHASASIPLGQPGLSFRYVQTFGETEVAYLSDTVHINFPWGIGTDGNNIWIGEFRGHRAIKYTSQGVPLMELGNAGFEGFQNQIIWTITDVGVDAKGNIGLADGDLSHILIFDKNGDFLSKLGQTWGPGSENDRFIFPASVTFDSTGNIYVSDGAHHWAVDFGNHRIQVFAEDGSYLTTLGTTGTPGADNSHLRDPRHISTFENLLYVADAGNHRVQIFDVSEPGSPTYVATIGVSGEPGSDNLHLNTPAGVAADSNRIYVADTRNNRVQVYDRTTRAYMATIGTGWGSENDQFKSPVDVAVDVAGNLYVADFENFRVQQFDTNLVYVSTFGVTGVPYQTDRLHYNQPYGVAVAPDDSVYIVEERGHRLVKLDANGVPQWSVSVPGVPGGWNEGENTHLNHPTDVALDDLGRIYVGDSNHRVQIFNSDGTYLGTIGSQGSGDGEFNGIGGLAVASNGHLYVADIFNHRVQIFDSNHNYLATLGNTGEPGADNSHFNEPTDVAVDSNGTIYVADKRNYRIQVFDKNRNYIRTIGETGISGSDFGHFGEPFGLSVDGENRLYVTEDWNDRVQVFDSSGTYLTTIGGSHGSRTGQLNSPRGIAVDRSGYVYIADYANHRIQKFAPGVPGWVQRNINGFGEQNRSIATLVPVGEYLYAGTYKLADHGAQLWRMDASGNWTTVITDGFGVYYNVGISHLTEFNGKLYAGVWNSTPNPPYTDTGGEIWRSTDETNWEQVVSGGFEDRYNGEVFRLAVFKDQIYASTWSYTSTHGAEIWRSRTGNSDEWERVVSNGFGDASNRAVLSYESHNGNLYAGTYNWNSLTMTTTGATVWRSSSGDPGTWVQVSSSGFGSTINWGVSSLASFDGYLYAGTVDSRDRGSEIWRCQVCDGNDWENVVEHGFGNSNNRGGNALEVFDGYLYMSTTNSDTGMEVWRSDTGNAGDWTQVGFAGLGDSNNTSGSWDKAMSVFGNSLYIGTRNSANGGEVWQFLHEQIYLPTLSKGQ